MKEFKIEYNIKKLLFTTIDKIIKPMGGDIRDIKGSRMELTIELDSQNVVNINGLLKEYGIVLTPYGGKGDLAIQIRDFLIATVDNEGVRTVKLSALLENQFELSYVHMAQTFSKAFHMSIEKFYIIVKIERAKELLLSGYRLIEIIEILDYSSVQHLSKQFKDLTGLTITEFIKMSELRLT